MHAAVWIGLFGPLGAGEGAGVVEDDVILDVVAEEDDEDEEERAAAADRCV